MKLNIKVAGVVAIVSFGPPKKGKERYFFQRTQLLFWNARFIIAASEGFIKNNFYLLVKLSKKNQLLPRKNF